MLLALVGIGVMGGAAFYLGWTLFSGEMEAAAASRLEVSRKRASNPLLRINRPIYRAVVLPYSVKIKAEDWRKKAKRKIISAGLEDEIDEEEIMAFKISMGVVVPIAIFIYLFASGGKPPVWMFFAMVFGGYFYPSIWVSGSRSRR